VVSVSDIVFEGRLMGQAIWWMEAWSFCIWFDLKRHYKVKERTVSRNRSVVMIE